jgi:hypothetical protein
MSQGLRRLCRRRYNLCDRREWAHSAPRVACTIATSPSIRTYAVCAIRGAVHDVRRQSGGRPRSSRTHNRTSDVGQRRMFEGVCVWGIWGSRARIDNRVVFVCAKSVCRRGCGEDSEVQQTELEPRRDIGARGYTGEIGRV